MSPSQWPARAPRAAGEGSVSQVGDAVWAQRCGTEVEWLPGTTEGCCGAGCSREPGTSGLGSSKDSTGTTGGKARPASSSVLPVFSGAASYVPCAWERPRENSELDPDAVCSDKVRV